MSFVKNLSLNRSNGFVCIMFPPIRKLLQGGGDMEKAESKCEIFLTVYEVQL